MENNNGPQQEVIDYILQAQKHGLTDFEIKQNLLNAGWDAGVVEGNFVFAKAADNNRPKFEDYSPKPQTIFEQSLPGGGKPGNLQPVASVNLTAAEPTVKNHASRKALIIIAVVLVLLALAGGVYGYYDYFYNKPQGAWKNFLAGDAPAQNVYKTDYSLSYDFGFQNTAASATPTTFGLSGTAYQDLSNLQDIKYSNDLNFLSKAGDQSTVNFSFVMLMLNKTLYVDLSKAEMLKSSTQEQALGWVKFDFDKIAEYVKTTTGREISGYKNPFDSNPAAAQKTFKDLARGKVILPGSFLSKETLEGAPVYHFKNEFDKEAFLPLLLEVLNEILKKSQNPNSGLTEEQKNIVTAIVNKVEIKELETWIGQKDHELYKIHFVASTPSMSDLLNTVAEVGSAKAIARDALRLAQIRQLAGVLELYNTDKKGYPAGSEGIPQNFAPSYIQEIPKAPLPADGTCTDYYNTFWYEAEGQPKLVDGISLYPSYSLSFCFGGDVGGYKGGIGKLTPQGIEANIACPSADDKCVNQNPPAPPGWDSIIAAWKFDGEIKFDGTYKDFGKTENLVAPTQAIDFIDLLTKQFGQNLQASDDAQRLSDVRQLAAALQMYFDDKESFPENLQGLMPTYIIAIPVAPAVVAGACTAQDNTYTYKKAADAEKYSLDFCLSAAVGGYTAGKHTLTELGIK